MVIISKRNSSTVHYHDPIFRGSIASGGCSWLSAAYCTVGCTVPWWSCHVTFGDFISQAALRCPEDANYGNYGMVIISPGLALFVT